MKTIRYLLIYWVIVPFSVLGQEPITTTLPARHYTVDEGLPIDEVWNLEMDGLGLIWIGTQAGLAVYDGVDIKTVSERINIRAMGIDHQDNIWMGLIDGEIQYYDRLNEQIRNLSLPFSVKESPLYDGVMAQLVFDQNGYLWVNTYFEGFYRIKLKYPVNKTGFIEADEIQYYHYNHNNFEAPDSPFLTDDPAGNIWVTTSKGLAHWNPDRENFSFFGSNAINPARGIVWGTIRIGKDQQSLWFTNSENHIIHFDPSSNTTTNISKQYGIEDIKVNQVYEDKKGNLWIVYGQSPSFFKIGWINVDRQRFERIKFQFTPQSFRLRTEIVKDFLEDEQGNIWIGIHAGALIKHNPLHTAFQKVKLQEGEQLPKLNKITQVLVDGNNALWVRSMDWMVRRVDPETGNFQSLDEIARENNLQLQFNRPKLGLKDPSGNIWIIDGKQVYRYDHEKRTLEHFNPKYTVLETLPKNYLQGFDFGPDSTLWLVQQNLIYHIDLSKNAVIRIVDANKWVDPDYDPKSVPFIIGTIKIDLGGKVWIGTEDYGFFQYDPWSEKVTKFPYSPGGVFAEHPNGYMYIATHSDGLIVVDKNSLAHHALTVSEGLPSNNLKGGLVIGPEGDLWVGTDQGLAVVNPMDTTVLVMDKSNGVFTNFFSAFSADCIRDEALVFGTLDGLLLLYPSILTVDYNAPKLTFTSFALFNKPLKPVANSPLDQSVAYQKEINLSYQQSDFSISFAAVHYKNPQKNQYAIKLEPYQKEWRNIGNQNTASYNNLSPGHYTFYVKAANSDGIWNEKGISLDIIIHPPWYWNIWSKSFYFILATSLAYLLYQFLLNRRLALAEANRLKELDAIKTTLYTNITHEFRTPLTAIKGTAEQIQGYNREKEIINRNTQQLLNLVNNMLDLSKIEAGKLTLNLIHGDILYYLRYVTESYHSLALNQKINLNFYSNNEVVEMDYDPDKILQILSNLISNAIKYTPEYGKVLVRAEIHPQKNTDILKLTIRDTGIGIPADQLPYIFDRFFRSENNYSGGTGIGLTLTKELAELMKGKILVESTVGKGSIFTVMLPIYKNAQKKTIHKLENAFALPPNSLEASILSDKISNNKDLNGDSSTILIVEDNQDVMYYLLESLKDNYLLQYAQNGREGIDKALEMIPDIIISDVMMPEIDGFELCATLKQDERTSHIPIILLTAKADIKSKIEGLEYGADAYLTKPFHRKELNVRLQKLLELRKTLQAKYNQPSFETKRPTQREDAFVTKVKQLILENLDEETFGIEELATAVNFSTTHVYRKLKALTGMSTSHFIRQIRLQKAHELLLNRDLKVSQVAYSVGFKDVSYFSKSFSKQFGKSPSKIAKRTE